MRISPLQWAGYRSEGRMAGDSEHKPLKPAHPAVKSIAGTLVFFLQVRFCSGVADPQLCF